MSEDTAVLGQLCAEYQTNWRFFAGIALKLEKVGPTFTSFIPCPSLPFVATDDRKQFHCLKYYSLK